ncbi:hypothetical protein Moror_17731 [Moniliophthora roreri MCA 2997]|uniref:BTB domain-containing protein n=1 Tax=Moniliophthora roreri (strain MCA 2997) TaxID=1381753 RepID=V2XXN1_MONRO|nr:hypothetical protein Moror_17731 [Moniliophthora roreri MCA 2997]
MQKITPATPRKHPLSFSDGNLAILTYDQYFLVHQGFLRRHSSVLDAEIKMVLNQSQTSLEGLPVLDVQEDPNDIYHFLLALYDGISDLKYDRDSFDIVASLLRLSTRFQVVHLRKELLRGLSAMWPNSLSNWDIREVNATNDFGIYEPRASIPHPITVINLARRVDAPEILPSAFYDLSRCSSARVAQGHMCTLTQELHQLSQDDLLSLLKGREHASRFLSTFLVHYVEGMAPSAACIYRRQTDITRRRACQSAFEGITFALLRDSNDVLGQRSSDPLFILMDAELMLTRYDGERNLRPCEFCREEFGALLDSAREEFWRQIPQFFGLDLPTWV